MPLKGFSRWSLQPDPSRCTQQWLAMYLAACTGPSLTWTWDTDRWMRVIAYAVWRTQKRFAVLASNSTLYPCHTAMYCVNELGLAFYHQYNRLAAIRYLMIHWWWGLVAFAYKYGEVMNGLVIWSDLLWKWGTQRILGEVHHRSSHLCIVSVSACLSVVFSFCINTILQKKVPDWQTHLEVFPWPHLFF